MEPIAVGRDLFLPGKGLAIRAILSLPFIPHQLWSPQLVLLYCGLTTLHVPQARDG